MNEDIRFCVATPSGYAVVDAACPASRDDGVAVIGQMPECHRLEVYQLASEKLSTQVFNELTQMM